LLILLLNVNPVYIILQKIEYVSMDIYLLVILRKIVKLVRDGLKSYKLKLILDKINKICYKV